MLYLVNLICTKHNFSHWQKMYSSMPVWLPAHEDSIHAPERIPKKPAQLSLLGRLEISEDTEHLSDEWRWWATLVNPRW